MRYLKHIWQHLAVSQWHPTPVLLPGKSHGRRSLVGCSPWGLEESDTIEWLHFHFHALEKEMATHSSVLAWRIPGTGKPGGLPSIGLHRVGHDWSDLAAAAAAVSGKSLLCLFVPTNSHPSGVGALEQFCGYICSLVFPVCWFLNVAWNRLI